MMPKLPISEILTTNRLGMIFSKTVATYKYFWFLSILQIHARTDNLRINVWDIVIRMVANAWYPIHYFRLSFGKSDSLFDIVMELRKITRIPIDANAESIIETLTDRLEERQIHQRLLRTLTLNVTYRFLRQWIDAVDHRGMVYCPQVFKNWSLYYFTQRE